MCLNKNKYDCKYYVTINITKILHIIINLKTVYEKIIKRN